MTRRKGKTIVRDHGYAAIIREIGRTADTFITVGVHASEDSRQGDETTNALVASVHEFGSDTVPQRSFLRSTIDSRRNDINEVIRKTHARMVDGKLTAKGGAGIIALWVENAVKATIRRGGEDWPPLAPSTIAAKGSSRPLIDTAQLIASIKGVVHQGARPTGGV